MWIPTSIRTRLLFVFLSPLLLFLLLLLLIPVQTMTVRIHTPPISGHEELFANVRDNDLEELWTTSMGNLIPVSVDELHLILTMAAPKTELIKFGHGPDLYIADIGIPGDLYEHFGIRQPDFGQSGIVKYTNIRG